ncbi:MAG: EscU/YscU/HrcU family type III secretion system export apparatus switch protein [Desulfobacterales bacterium]|nr:EscU/YscU/HrcU family type III secretion system export apparatus switch protein [Desulfobacterales bacterium]
MMEKGKKAAAITYEKGKDCAPRVVAKGQGEMAERILAVARANGVPIHHDRNLAQILGAMDLEVEIPPELYRAVAEVLVFIYSLEHRNPERS